MTTPNSNESDMVQSGPSQGQTDTQQSSTSDQQVGEQPDAGESSQAQGFWQEPTEPLEKGYQPVDNRSQKDRQ